MTSLRAYIFYMFNVLVQLLTRTTMLPTATSLPEKERVYMTWKKNGVTLFPLVYSRPPYRSVLTIFKAEEQDEGGYQCHVSLSFIYLLINY